MTSRDACLSCRMPVSMLYDNRNLRLLSSSTETLVGLLKVSPRVFGDGLACLAQSAMEQCIERPGSSPRLPLLASRRHWLWTP